MTRCTWRTVFTVLLYGGVGVFLFPYLTGHLGHALTYLLIGIGIAVTCGILRCCCVEGDCTEREAAGDTPAVEAQSTSRAQPVTHSSL